MDLKNFAILTGTGVTIRDGKISFKAPSKRGPRVRSTQQITNSPADQIIIRSDISFGNGTLEFILKAKSHSIGILLKTNSFDNKKVRIGYSRQFSQFTIVKLVDGWKSLGGVGNISNYPLNEDIHFKINVEGSLITMYVNNVVMCEANQSLKETPIEFVISSDGDWVLSNIKIERSSPKLFVVMQFSHEYNELYEEVIKPVSEEFGYECIRADEFYTSTPILSDIITSIQEATAIIAEITPDNPNVFYEIGYSHAIKKPTILLCDKKREKLPFDLSSFRTLYYENTIAGKKKVEASLKKYLENLV